MITSDGLRKHEDELKKLYKSNPINFIKALKELKKQHGNGRRQERE